MSGKGIGLNKTVNWKHNILFIFWFAVKFKINTIINPHVVKVLVRKSYLKNKSFKSIYEEFDSFSGKNLN